MKWNSEIFRVIIIIQKSCRSLGISITVYNFIAQVHVSESSSIPDHCSVFALSDPQDLDYQATCTHDHNDLCGKCNGLTETLEEVKKAIEKTKLDPEDLSKREIHHEVAFMTRRAKRDVSA